MADDAMPRLFPTDPLKNVDFGREFQNFQETGSRSAHIWLDERPLDPLSICWPVECTHAHTHTLGAPGSASEKWRLIEGTTCKPGQVASSSTAGNTVRWWVQSPPRTRRRRSSELSHLKGKKSTSRSWGQAVCSLHHGAADSSYQQTPGCFRYSWTRNHPTAPDRGCGCSGMLPPLFPVGAKLACGNFRYVSAYRAAGRAQFSKVWLDVISSHEVSTFGLNITIVAACWFAGLFLRSCGRNWDCHSVPSCASAGQHQIERAVSRW